MMKIDKTGRKRTREWIKKKIRKKNIRMHSKCIGQIERTVEKKLNLRLDHEDKRKEKEIERNLRNLRSGKRKI